MDAVLPFDEPPPPVQRVGICTRCQWARWRHYCRACGVFYFSCLCRERHGHEWHHVRAG